MGTVLDLFLTCKAKEELICGFSLMKAEQLAMASLEGSAINRNRGAHYFYTWIIAAKIYL